MYQRILLPTDGSPETASAVEQALDLAEQYGATLHVLYVVDTNALPLDAHAQLIVEYLEEQGRESEADVVARAEERGIETVVGVAEGSPHEAILEYVADNDIDLVVMGTHGRRGIDRYLLGSVTARVLRLTDVPVLTVRAQAPPENEA